MYHAREVVAIAETLSGEQQKELEALKTGDEKTKVWAENWYDGLTYCGSSKALRYMELMADIRKAHGTR